MERRTLLVTLAVLAAVAAAVPAVAVAGVDGAEIDDNETNDTAPGERLAGVVGVQGAEVDGELDERSFRVGLNRSAAGASAVVDARLPGLEQRVEEIERRRAALDEARENGTITEGEYRARLATLIAESRNVRRMANVSGDALAAEPGVLSAERSERIRSLRERADNATGPETAELARSIAGANVGGGLDDRPAPPEDRPAGNESAADDDRGPGNDTDGPGKDGSDRSSTDGTETDPTTSSTPRS